MHLLKSGEISLMMRKVIFGVWDVFFTKCVLFDLLFLGRIWKSFLRRYAQDFLNQYLRDILQIFKTWYLDY